MPGLIPFSAVVVLIKKFFIFFSYSTQTIYNNGTLHVLTCQCKRVFLGHLKVMEVVTHLHPWVK